MNAAWTDRYMRALDATHEAGRRALEFFDRPLTVEWKANESPVTIADREAENLLRQKILSRFPEDGFIGEEFGKVEGHSDFTWIVDPVDGTRSFVRGIPFWGTLVGLLYRGEPIAGICYIPPLNITYRGMRGEGAFREHRKLSVSNVEQWPESQVFFSNLTLFMMDSARDGFMDLLNHAQRTRGYGDFYGFMLVAQGSGEVMLEYGVSSWDIAALIPIVEEAGGAFTDWDGNKSIHRPDVIATNGKMHRAALDILRKHRGPDWQKALAQHQTKIV